MKRIIFACLEDDELAEEIKLHTFKMQIRTNAKKSETQLLRMKYSKDSLLLDEYISFFSPMFNILNPQII